MKRRNFLKTSSMLAASGLLAYRSSFANIAKPIGLQLYTIRKEMQTDLLGSLKKVAEIGYTQVEMAGYNNGQFYGKSPMEFKQICDDLGLRIISSHSGMNVDNVAKIAEDSKAVGVEYLVLPFLGGNERKTLDDYKMLGEKFNTYGTVCKNAGLKFAYHNHDFEFTLIDNQVPYDLLLQNTDPTLVSFEVDLYWIIKAGYKPLDYFAKYPGRFSMWHVKDRDAASGKFTEVGKGNVDFKGIFAKKAESGMEYFFVELDMSVIPAMDSIKISFDYLNQADFVR
ncbi:MAG: sugar phosphate isomerase/epimerase [Cyclobacteriaceae bacterium]|nr:sugar phosphate isomerase/epimerase [Cyclobacteriaceae bacterium]